MILEGYTDLDNVNKGNSIIVKGRETNIKRNK